jgi:hypothetical protein
MLNIQPEQMAELGRYAHERYVQAMARHLRSTFPERTATLDHDTLCTAVRQGMQQAQAHRVLIEDDIRRFLEYLVIYGSPLDQRPNAPWIGEILRHPELDGTDKLDRIAEQELALMRAAS